jgi:hypothetical protein
LRIFSPSARWKADSFRRFEALISFIALRTYHRRSEKFNSRYRNAKSTKTVSMDQRISFKVTVALTTCSAQIRAIEANCISKYTAVTITP